MSKLAIKGGSRIRETRFPAYQVMGDEEAQAAQKVVKSGVLSQFLGCWHPDFYGGEQVQALEKEWADLFQVKHAITVNSNTSGIFCALGAAGIGPGDEVIVSPYSMSISASAPLFFGAVPVFADIEPDGFCLDPTSVEAKITERTKAILVVDLFGHPYDADKINQIAKKHSLPVIEDCAQAPYIKLNDTFAGSLGDVGIFSLNYHQHIHCGEGGVIVTNDDDIATRCQLIRNHAEAVVDDMEYKGSPVNMIGLNFRMPEIEAAITRCQLKKLPHLVRVRQEHVAYFEDRLASIDFITMPQVRVGAEHAYYVHAMKFDKEKAGVDRDTFVHAVAAELTPEGDTEYGQELFGLGYTKPLYWQSLYQNQTGIGSSNYPFKDPSYKGELNYERGLAPVTEKLHLEELFYHDRIHANMSRSDIDHLCDAFLKVAENIDDLR